MGSKSKQVPYIGSQISLVSRSEIRYVGTLANINIEDSTVSVKSVKVYGTEGRREGGVEIPPSDEVFECVVFKAADIKDLDVWSPTNDEESSKQVEKDHIEKSTQEAVPPTKALGNMSLKPTDKNGTADDSTKPIHSKVQNPGGQSTGYNTKQQPDHHADRSSWRDRSHGGREYPNQYHRQQNNNRHGPNGFRGPPNRYNHHHNNNGYKRYNNNPPRMKKETFKEDFDFQSMNEKFDKEKEKAALLADNVKAETGDDNEGETSNGEDVTATQNSSGYSKSSFFDTISCDITDRQSGKSTRLSGSEERSLNTETFGATGVAHTRRYNRGGYGGRNHGYRGRGRYNHHQQQQYHMHPQYNHNQQYNRQPHYNNRGPRMYQQHNNRGYPGGYNRGHRGHPRGHPEGQHGGYPRGPNEGSAFPQQKQHNNVS